MSEYWDKRFGKQFNQLAAHIFTEGYYSSEDNIAVYDVNTKKNIKYQRVYPNSCYESLLAMEKNFSFIVREHVNYSIVFYYGMDRII